MDVRLAIKVQRDGSGALTAIVSELASADAQATKTQGAIGKAMSHIAGKAGEAQKGLAGMAGEAGALAAAMGPAGIAVATVGGALVAIAGATASLVSRFATVSGEITDMAASMGVSTTAFQEFRNTAGASTDDIAASIRTMEGNLASGSKAFERLGLSTKELTAMKPEDAFRSVAAAVAGIGNETLRTAAAQDVFGKASAKSLPFIISNMEEARQRAHALGGVIDSDTVAAGDRLGDALDDVSYAFGNVLTQIGAAIGKNPELISSIEGIATAIGKVANAVGEAGALIREHPIITNILTGGALSAMGAVNPAIGRLNTALSGGSAAQAAEEAWKKAQNFVEKGGQKGGAGPTGVYRSEAQMKAAEEARKKALKSYVEDLKVQEEAQKAAAAEFKVFLDDEIATLAAGYAEIDAMEAERVKGQAGSMKGTMNRNYLQDGMNLKLGPSGGLIDEPIKKAVSSTVDWSRALQDLTNAFQALGITAEGSLARITVGFLSGMAAAQQFKEAGTTSEKIAIGAETAVSIYSSNKTNRSGTSAALSGAAQGAAAGSAFGPYGIVIGAVAGGLIGYFSGSEWRKVAKQAGKVLGIEVSDELMKAIQATQEKLGVSLANAALLNLSGAMGESMAAGGSARDFSGQTVALMAAIRGGAVPAAAGLSQIGQAFSKIAAEALQADVAGDKALRDIIRASKGLNSPEIKAFLQQQMQTISAGLGQGLSIAMTDEQSARDQGSIFAVSFWAAVQQDGYVAAADAFRGTFDTLRTSMEAWLTPEDLALVMGPIERIMNLTNESTAFRGATEGAKGLADVLAGLANSDIPLTVDQFGAFERQAEAARQQAIAGGATEAESYMAIGPLLQRLSEVSRNYGIELDAQTQEMMKQAEAAGVAFKTDPMDRAADSMERVARVLERIYGISSDVSDSFGEIATNGRAASDSVGGITYTPRTGGVAGGEPYMPGDGFAGGGVVSGPLSGYWARLHGTERITPMGASSSGGSEGAIAAIQALAQQVGTLAQVAAVARGDRIIQIEAAPITIEATAMGEGVIEERALRAMRDALWSGNLELVEAVRHATE